MSTADDYLRLASVDNFRDVAGPGYATVDQGVVRTGVFFRSNDLRLTEEDHGSLTELGLSAVIDLRSEVEVALHPDPELPGTEALHFDAAGIPMERLASLPSKDAAVELMLGVYRGFVQKQSSRDAFGAVLSQLARGGPHPSRGHAPVRGARAGGGGTRHRPLPRLSFRG